jgi:hypothetical protein
MGFLPVGGEYLPTIRGVCQFDALLGGGEVGIAISGGLTAGVELQDILSYIMNAIKDGGGPLPRTSDTPKGETFTFRLDPAMKVALTRSAADEHMQPAELLRRLVRDHLVGKERRAFEAEARRQSRAIAERAGDPKSDDAQVMREIAADLERDDFADEWKA